MKDFIHKTLINAGGKDAVSNMLTGAAMGAGANTALGVIQGDFDIIGNATSGALLGTVGGAALRHAGDKYTAGLAKMGKDAPSEFKFSTFSNAEKDSLNFMGSEEGLKRAQAMASNIPSSASSAGAKAEAPTGGSITPKQKQTGPSISDQIQDEIAQGNARNSTEALKNLRTEAKERSAKDLSTLSHTRTDGNASKRSYADRAAKRQQAKAAQMEKDVLDAKKANREDLKSTFNRNKVREQSIDRRQQRVMDKQIDSDIKSVNGDLSQMGNMPYTPNEIAKGYQRSGKDANQWAQDTVAKQTQTAKDAQGAAGDLIAGIFKETGRGPIKKPTSFADGAGTLSLPKGKIDSSNFKPSYRNGEYVHPQHNKVKKYQPEK